MAEVLVEKNKSDGTVVTEEIPRHYIQFQSGRDSALFLRFERKPH
jgi:hypothetical protein